jgi:peptide/nickel transport system permease protein
MVAYVIRRILLMPVILFFVSLVTFVIINLQGNPLSRFAFNPRVKPEDIARMEHNLGLDKPLMTRFFLYLESLIKGDLQNSLINSKKVTLLIGDAMPNTLRLAVVSVIVALLLATPIAIYAATHRNSAADRFILTTAVAGSSLPTVWLGLLLIILFAVKFREWGLPKTRATPGDLAT